MPEYSNDTFCDDENNNEECNWDGGACCQGSLFNFHWEEYCDECECLDPDAGTVCLWMDHWPWMSVLRGIFLSLMCEEIFKNGSNII